MTTIYGTVRGRDGARPPDPNRFNRRAAGRNRGLRTPLLLCSECGGRMSRIERRVQEADGSWRTSDAPTCGTDGEVAPVEWNAVLARCRRYIETAYINGGWAAVDELCDRPDAVLFPGVSPGELSLVRSYWRKWGSVFEIRAPGPDMYAP